MFLAQAMPFADARGVMPVFERYLGMYDTYVCASFNAPNFLSAIGGNLKPDDTVLSGLSLAVWSKLFLGLALGAGFVCAAKKRKGIFADPLVAGAYCSMAFFYFASRMHERYSFLAMVLMLGAWLVTADRRLLVAHLVLAATFFVNVLRVYLMSLDKKYHIASDDVLLFFLSCFNAVPFLLSGWVLLLPKRVNSFIRTGRFQEATSLSDAVVRERRKLAVAVAALVLVCGFLFFWRLGSTKAPVTEWVAKSAPIVTLDLGKKQYIAAVMVFAGPEHNGCLNIETSDDGRFFTHSMFVEKPWVFKWEQKVLGLETRYVRVKARDPATRLMELVLQDNSGNPIPVVEIDPPSAKAIADEPQTAPALAHSYNSSFFDEIYFARTAYEHLKELPIYENTHPPFGKVVISGGIALLGLSPFSWRLPGALLGVVSGVLALLLARAVFRSTSAGFVAGVLFGLDGLLISQSRIATVDAQIVAFTLAAFCFGWWFYSSHALEGWKRSWWKLVMSWMFFGLAGATKWNGFFSGPALLLLTTAPWWKALLQGNRNWWLGNRWRILAAPVIALITALLVYFLTYVFVLSDTQGRDWRWVLQQPKNIYSYHSGGALEHPFSSPWWSWLLNFKSVWQHTDRIAGMTIDRVCLGNPFVYWTAALSLPVFFLLAVFRLLKKRDMDAFLILTAFVSCLVPWIFVGRSTFLYHFLPALPFYVMMPVGVVWYMTECDKTGILRRLGTAVLLALGIVGTVLFYPLQAGMPTDSAYRQAVRWLNSSEQNRAWFGWSWSN
jgi:dolichyl-phosphate-mannose-protein mannosyltransferase